MMLEANVRFILQDFFSKITQTVFILKNVIYILFSKFVLINKVYIKVFDAFKILQTEIKSHVFLMKFKLLLYILNVGKK